MSEIIGTPLSIHRKTAATRPLPIERAININTNEEDNRLYLLWCHLMPIAYIGLFAFEKSAISPGQNLINSLGNQFQFGSYRTNKITAFRDSNRKQQAANRSATVRVE